MNEMKYVFCTLAVGDRYYENALRFAKKLNEISTTHKVLIVTDKEYDNVDNTIFIKLPETETLLICNHFNYNLKYIPIKACSILDFDFIIYIDSDWEIYEDYSEQKVLTFLDNFTKSDYDFLFERPHYIGGKHDLHNCFWRHKIEPYKLMETDKYDTGHVCNEQFLAFKNNDKLKIFCEKWEERCNFCVENNIWTFAEGVEIGMSTIDADMKFSWSGFDDLRSCFKFTSTLNIEYIRF